MSQNLINPNIGNVEGTEYEGIYAVCSHTTPQGLAANLALAKKAGYEPWGDVILGPNNDYICFMKKTQVVAQTGGRPKPDRF